MAFADRLEAALKERAFEPLIDRSEIYAFEDWWKRIQALIAQADTVIFVLSPDAVASEVCAKEVAFAASLNKRFAPVIGQEIADISRVSSAEQGKSWRKETPAPATAARIATVGLNGFAVGGAVV
jgi:hypothetical protein